VDARVIYRSIRRARKNNLYPEKPWGKYVFDKWRSRLTLRVPAGLFPEPPPANGLHLEKNSLQVGEHVYHFRVVYGSKITGDPVGLTKHDGSYSWYEGVVLDSHGMRAHDQVVPKQYIMDYAETRAWVRKYLWGQYGFEPFAGLMEACLGYSSSKMSKDGKHVYVTLLFSEGRVREQISAIKSAFKYAMSKGISLRLMKAVE
jgi:hypothetical protein